ncbi:MAG: hypothetical protein L6R42_005092 [Xanthoria sp. 1 TBL-2021]|nr:MAG: hypothetical protein L6R42_005092 [Xanthoria sp. 1 TBL-2021]
MPSILAAHVLQWDARRVIIRCPYCQKKHRHGTGVCEWNPSTLTGQSRVSHCDENFGDFDQYRLHYPFEDETEPTSWEIEKEEGKFVTIGLPWHTSYDDDDRASISDDGIRLFCEIDNEDSKNEEPDKSLSLSDQFGELSVAPQQPQIPASLELRLSFDDEILEELMRDQKYRLSVYVSHCILNKGVGIRAPMANYNDDFLSVSDRTGNNGIALTAVEGHLQLLQWLHEQGCDIHNRNCRGRTPLMMASLWGRVHIVDYLLEKGADATLRDHKGRSALDLALPDPRNRNERKRRMVLYREPHEADQYRHRIAIQLQISLGTVPAAKYDPTPERQRNTTGFFLDSWSSSQSGAIDYYELDQRYSIPDARKAIGRLDRGPLFPVISAMSGYSHSEWDPLTVLDNVKWTEEVMNLGRRLNVPVEQSYASHVEKQLLAFYVSKHVLLDDEHMELQKVKPPGLPVGATIVVSKDKAAGVPTPQDASSTTTSRQRISLPFTTSPDPSTKAKERRARLSTLSAFQAATTPIAPTSTPSTTLPLVLSSHFSYNAA